MCHLKKWYTIVLFYFPRFIVYILCLIIYLEEDYNKKKRLDAVFMNQMIFWGKINNIYIYIISSIYIYIYIYKTEAFGASTTFHVNTI